MIRTVRSGRSADNQILRRGVCAVNQRAPAGALGLVGGRGRANAASRSDGARRGRQKYQGVEEQTPKLFEVCRLRDVPITTFINKLDREGRDPFDLLGEIGQSLALDATPVSWPIGMGPRKGHSPGVLFYLRSPA